LRVLDLTRLYPGAFCTSLLADLGADVVKVEAPGAGDGMRFVNVGDFKAAHVALNRGKRSITLNLKHERAGEVLRRLVRDADVVIESQRPGAMEALGLGFEQLRAENPRLVWCTISGFGSDGPLASAPGHDITYLGYAGLLSQLSGGTVAPPVPDIVLSIPLAAVLAATGILAAVVAREHTGVGSRVDACMADAAMWPLSEEVAKQATAPSPGWGSFSARQVYRCADDRFVTVTATEPKSWAALVAALDLPDLADHQLGVDEDETTRRLAAVFVTKPAADWLREPGFAGGVGPVNEPADLLTDEHVAARAGIVEIEGADGPRVLANPLRFDGADGRGSSWGRSAAPGCGEHTDEVLAAAGLTEEEIAALREQQAI
jgi:crotonobetainyl-CoA:carnitine CoA-transferase CaiB-like acyl-CoA transferase